VSKTVKRPIAIYIALAWLVSAGASIIGFMVHYRSPGGYGAILRYFGLMIGFGLTFVISTSNMPLWQSIIFIVCLGIPILGMVSLFNAPSIGYGGQIFMFAIYAILTTIVLSVALLSFFHARKKDLKILSLKLFIAQVCLIFFSFTLTGSFEVLHPVQQRSGRIIVRQFNIGNQDLSFPLLEEKQLFLVDRSGVLYKVDLESNRAMVIVELPLPDPEEAGFTPERGYPNISSPPGEKSPRPWFSKIYRSGPDTLCVEYPYHIGEFHKHPDGYEYSANQGLWHIRSVVDINKKTVTSWEVKQGPGGLELTYPHPVRSGDFQAIYGDFRESIHITGPGADTRIWPAGRVIWLAASKRHIIAGTNKGRVYLVEVPAEEQEEDNTEVQRKILNVFANNLTNNSREVKQLRLISTTEQNLIDAKSFPKKHAVLKKEDGGVIRWEIKLGDDTFDTSVNPDIFLLQVNERQYLQVWDSFKEQFIRYGIPPEIDEIKDIYSTDAIFSEEKKLFIAATLRSDGKLYSFKADLDNCILEIVWEKHFNNHINIAGSNGIVLVALDYFLDGEGKLAALSESDGKTLWEKPINYKFGLLSNTFQLPCEAEARFYENTFEMLTRIGDELYIGSDTGCFNKLKIE
jgi:hypothetical protein